MQTERHDVAGVRFRDAGRVFYYAAAGMRLEAGEHVVVETTRGPEVARVVIGTDQVVVNELNQDELKPILRLATDDDIQKADALRQRSKELLPEARRLADEAGFRGRVDTADFTLDGRRLSFTFSSEERLDYRDFVRAASDRFGARCDIRQVGARDRARLAGGYGICGRELCCSNWLSSFPAISIKMAKDQELPLHPQKISGLCGRLLCCLSYEDEGYKEMRSTMPRVGQRCSTPTGEGKVIAVNILRRQVTLLVEGQRMEIQDRELGTVVRWDPSSRSAEPPPSLGPLPAADRDDGDDGTDEGFDVDAVVGRGRLPGGGPRRVVPPREQRPQPQRPGGPPPAAAGRPGGPPRGRAGEQRPQREPRPGGQSPSARPPSPTPSPGLPPAGRRFERRPPGQDAPPQGAPSADGDAPGGGGGASASASASRGRRRRGRGGAGAA